MKGYLGEKVVGKSETEFKDFNKYDWAGFWIESYGQIDGSHHKAWVLDQVKRILCDTEVIIEKASWDNGQVEFRVSLEEPSKEYLDFVTYYENDGEYEWDCGIAP